MNENLAGLSLWLSLSPFQYGVREGFEIGLFDFASTHALFVKVIKTMS